MSPAEPRELRRPVRKVKFWAMAAGRAANSRRDQVSMAMNRLRDTNTARGRRKGARVGLDSSGCGRKFIGGIVDESCRD